MSSKEVAVVFVHGIGTQLRSSTLSSWGEPLTDSLNRRLARSSDGAVVYIKNSRLTLGERAEVTLVVPSHDGADGALRPETTVYMTEAWWADAFLPQGAASVLGWGFKFAAFAVSRPVVHVSRLCASGLRGQFVVWSNMWKACKSRPGGSKIPITVLLLAYLGGFLLTLPLALVAFLVAIPLLVVGLVVVAASTLVIFAAVKVPRLGKYVRPIANTLVASVGDASVWTSEPIAAAAMRTVVIDAIDRARARLTGDSQKRVILVAHSQGAAIAVDTLFGNTPDSLNCLNPEHRPTVLVTVGGAMQLLKDASHQSRQSGRSNAFDPIEAWKCSKTRWINAWALWDPVSSGPMGKGRRGSDRRRFRACLASGVEFAKRYRDRDVADRKNETVMPSLRPALVNPDAEALKRAEDGPEEWPVYNTSLLTTDHTTYTNNIVQVIDPLRDLILNVAHDRSQPDAHDQDPTFIRRTERHIVGVRRVVVVRILALLAILAYAPTLFSGLQRVPWLRGTANELDTRINAAISDRFEPVQELWTALRFMPVGTLAVWLLYVLIVYLLIVAIFKVPIKWSERRNIRAESLGAKNNVWAKVAVALMFVLAAAIVWRLLWVDPWRTFFATGWRDGGFHLWGRALVVVAFATLVLQAQWGTRMYRVDAMGQEQDPTIWTHHDADQDGDPLRPEPSLPH